MRVTFVLSLLISLALFHPRDASGASVSVFSKDIGAPIKATQVGSGFAVQPEVSNRKPVGNVIRDYSITPAPTGSFSAVVTIADDFNQLSVFDSSGSILTLKLTYPDTTFSTYVVEPGGPGLTNVGAPSGTALSIQSAGATAVTGGTLIINAFK